MALVRGVLSFSGKFALTSHHPAFFTPSPTASAGALSSGCRNRAHRWQLGCEEAGSWIRRSSSRSSGWFVAGRGADVGGGRSGVVCPSSGAAEAGRRGVRVSAAATISTMGVEVAEKMDPVQQRLMFEDECILVDEKDNVVGHDSKYNCHLMEKIEADNLLHRAFSVFLFNSKNELLLQKRSATKVTFPMVWTNTCCSHPLYRDSELIKEGHLGVRNAAQRKLFDELGIEAPDAPVDDFTCLGRILYKAPSDGKWGEHELDYLVFMKRDVAVKPNPEEVDDVMYVTKEQLQELVSKAKTGQDGVKLSPWFQLVVENFLYDWWKRIEEGTLSEVADMETIHKLT